MLKTKNVFILFFILGCNMHQDSITKPLSQSEAINQANQCYKELKSDLVMERKNEMKNREITLNDVKMKFDLKYYGVKPKEGWSLYFSLHGGGQTEPAVNEKQWVRHQTLYEVNEGIVFIPRSPTNTWNMWHQDHIDPLFNRIIQNMIMLYEVDPNKVYLMGYSAGGDGVYQLAPRMADRFAAAAMMAGHPNETSPLGLRNLPFTIHMGENDTPYNRNKVATEWKGKLKDLRNNDPEGYPHLVTIHQDKGHWMELLDTVAITWMSRYRRNPFPEKIVWKQDDVTHNRFYWLRDENPTERSLIVASIKRQTIIIENSSVTEFTIMLNDSLLDMDKRVIVKYDDKEIFNAAVPRTSSTILKSIREYGDPNSVYYGEIPISLENVTK
ncbi:MAG: dienelactone hydrolase family protein [Candidatus Neomarinimicrobiota bacterium]